MQGISATCFPVLNGCEETVDSDATLPVRKSISSAKVNSKLCVEAMTFTGSSTKSGLTNNSPFFSSDNLRRCVDAQKRNLTLLLSSDGPSNNYSFLAEIAVLKDFLW